MISHSLIIMEKPYLEPELYKDYFDGHLFEPDKINKSIEEVTYNFVYGYVNETRKINKRKWLLRKKKNPRYISIVDMGNLEFRKFPQRDQEEDFRYLTLLPSLNETDRNSQFV